MVFERGVSGKPKTTTTTTKTTTTAAPKTTTTTSTSTSKPRTYTAQQVKQLTAQGALPQKEAAASTGTTIQDPSMHVSGAVERGLLDTTNKNISPEYVAAVKEVENAPPGTLIGSAQERSVIMPVSEYVEQQQQVLGTNFTDIKQAQEKNKSIFQENLSIIKTNAQNIAETYKFLEPYSSTDVFTLASDTSGKTYTKAELEAMMKTQQSSLLFAATDVTKATIANAVSLNKSTKALNETQNSLNQIQNTLQADTLVKVTSSPLGTKAEILTKERKLAEEYASMDKTAAGIRAASISILSMFRPESQYAILSGGGGAQSIVNFAKTTFEWEANLPEDPLEKFIAVQAPAYENVILPLAGGEILKVASVAAKTPAAAKVIGTIAGKEITGANVIKGLQTTVGVVASVGIGTDIGTTAAYYEKGLISDEQIYAKAIGYGEQFSLLAVGAGALDKIGQPKQETFPGMKNIKKAQELTAKIGDVETKFDNIRIGVPAEKLSSNIEITRTDLLKSTDAGLVKRGDIFKYTETATYGPSGEPPKLYIDFPGVESAAGPRAKIISLGTSEVIGEKIGHGGKNEPIIRKDVLTGVDIVGKQQGGEIKTLRQFSYEVLEPEKPLAKVEGGPSRLKFEKVGDIDWFKESSGAQPLSSEMEDFGRLQISKLKPILEAETKPISFVETSMDTRGLTLKLSEKISTKMDSLKVMLPQKKIGYIEAIGKLEFPEYVPEMRKLVSKTWKPTIVSQEKPKISHDIKEEAQKWSDQMKKLKDEEESVTPLKLESNVYKSGEKSIGHTGSGAVELSLEPLRGLSRFEKALIKSEIEQTPIFNVYPTTGREPAGPFVIPKLTAVSDVRDVLDLGSGEFYGFEKGVPAVIDKGLDLPFSDLRVEKAGKTSDIVFQPEISDLKPDIIIGEDIFRASGFDRATLPDFMRDTEFFQKTVPIQDLITVPDVVPIQDIFPVTELVPTMEIIPEMPIVPGLPRRRMDLFGDSDLGFGEDLFVFGRTRKYATGDIGKAFKDLEKAFK